MRILRLDLTDRTVELHPYVSVVRGLAPAARAQLLEELASVTAGRAAVSGLLEAHGVLLDLSPEMLALLDLPADLDVVVRPTDLPGAADPERERVDAQERARLQAAQAVAAAETEAAGAQLALEGAEEALAAARSGDPEGLTGSTAELDRRALARAEAEHALDEADSATTVARQALVDAEHAAAAARRARTDATRAVAVAAAALEAATDRRDPIAPAAVAAAQDRLDEAELVVVAPRDGDTVDQPDSATVDATDDALVETERANVEAALLALEAPDPLPVRLALEQLTSDRQIELVPSVEAQALADRWARATAELERSEVADDPADDRTGGDLRSAAVGRVREAEQTVAQTEVALRGPVLDADDLVALEAAHVEVLAARDGAERRFGAAKAASRITAAEKAEQNVLDRIGFLTYAEFQINSGRVTTGAAETSPEHLEAARVELAEAEKALAVIDAGVAAELVRAQLIDRRRAIRTLAVELLGSDPGDAELEAVLRRVRVPMADAGRLREALVAAGVELGDEDLPARFLVDLAKAWLREHAQTDASRRALEARLGELDALVAGRKRREELTRRPVDGSDEERLTAAIAVADEARNTLAAAQSRLERHLGAERDVEACRSQLEAAAAAEGAATQVVAAAEDAVVSAVADQQRAVDSLADAERAVVAARTQEAAAEGLLTALTGRVDAARHEGLDRLQDDVSAAAAAVTRTRAVLEEAHRVAAMPEAAESAGSSARHAAAEDTEWYLLARLAAQRAVSFAGSVPLVLDDALVDLTPADAKLVLGRLERMAASVQVVLVTEDLATAAWAEGLGLDRAAVVDA